MRCMSEASRWTTALRTGVLIYVCRLRSEGNENRESIGETVKLVFLRVVLKCRKVSNSSEQEAI